MFCKTEEPITLLPHCISLPVLLFDFSFSLLLSLRSTKEPGIQTPIRWLFWGHLLGLPAPWLKSLPCLKTSSVRFIDLVYYEQSRVSLDLVTVLTPPSQEGCLGWGGQIWIRYIFYSMYFHKYVRGLLRYKCCLRSLCKFSLKTREFLLCKQI